MMFQRYSNFFLFFFIYTVTSLLPTSLYAQEVSMEEPQVSLEQKTPEEVNSILAKLSDEHIRGLLISELQREAEKTRQQTSSQTGWLSLVVNWVRLLEKAESEESGLQISEGQGLVSTLFSDFNSIVKKLITESNGASLILNVFLLCLVFLLGFGTEKIYIKVTRDFNQQLTAQMIPKVSGFDKFGAAFLHALPRCASLLVLGVCSFFFFFLTPLNDISSFRLLFMAILFVLLAFRVAVIVSRILFAPDSPSLRIVTIGDEAARSLHKVVVYSSFFVVFAYAFLALLAVYGITPASGTLLALILGTIFLLLISVFVLQHRHMVKDHILTSQQKVSDTSWFIQQFALLWHVLALLYIFIVWLNFLYVGFSGSQQENGALLLSLLIVPIFLLLNSLGQWVVRTTVTTLRLYETEETEPEDSDLASTAPTPEEKERVLITRIGWIVRLAIVSALFIWILSLWGYTIPYATAITQAVFESLVTLSLALLFWRVSSSYIEKKMQEAEPDSEDEVKDDDASEWGGSVQRGRSYTLLPMVRKFIGTVLSVMVVLIILSSIGVNIGPLLAGAGVVGLAIGFGAQKLVSDVFSGFFYLLDDAFRVGEYLQTGTVSGTVEDITLRNVMLRHHRGMLQIVPYSELGSITNYMRGGITVKFNLEFPYGTDIDLVRRVIKKVGRAMLEEDEFKDDFLQPVKSQGVREITNSVMVIRVKFTAKPGTHFYIRREAYRRITEALMKKGLHYAHRKVIVELPENSNDDNGLDQQKLAEAGAAAGLAAMAQDENNTAKE